MRQPGFKVLHVPDVDVRASCLTFNACLGIVRDWSRVHPRHAPILILINAKDGRKPPAAPRCSPLTKPPSMLWTPRCARPAALAIADAR
jgi:hypothetical protein